MIKENKPEYGKQYRLTGGAGVPCIANGSTWSESEVVINSELVKSTIENVYLPVVEKLHTDWLIHYGADRQGFAGVEYGSKFAKVCTGELVDGKVERRSVHTFIDLTSGDILKAGSWRAPAKNGVRGNIYSPNFQYVINWHGAKYINGGMKGRMKELKK